MADDKEKPEEGKEEQKAIKPPTGADELRDSDVENVAGGMMTKSQVITH